ncbi:SAM-dependent methyltransferase [Flavobacterium cyanobacteriorum]|uniref:SAM-dependent methyltransferase n=1 Tax=Flavobacterium cyanobacteriorum TaxID=2022802 RepID=A0A255ZWZ3_9FLAO|nr:tRNA (5-methylaminomethyl-2-thiouridine)(34)-methyltransferase MnmD [Flavobacterium cyanobacteriorum]OYQ45300.1 SAM-dependent methyltransferase [Flavobacterium cyanobacteriorum]
MKREIITTADGSVTIHLPEMKESYHSKFGAIQEAYHVFIKNGLRHFSEYEQVDILEIGFGTGLNAFITFLESRGIGKVIHYTGIEAFPVNGVEVAALNYVEQLKAMEYSDIFLQMHATEWGQQAWLNDNFMLIKKQQYFEEINDEGQYDLIYFDAFGYHAQPELWSAKIFKKMYKALKPKGLLVTYACRTVIKKAMQEAGFTTEKLPGPPGKREMLRGYK